MMSAGAITTPAKMQSTPNTTCDHGAASSSKPIPMMASIALKRRAGIREFTDEFVSSPPVQAMMSRVDTVFDQAIEARGFDKMRSIVEIDLTDGGKLSQPSDERYRGGPERPFTREELHEKFTDCASLILSSDRIKRALDAIESVDQLKSIRDLTAALVQA